MPTPDCSDRRSQKSSQQGLSNIVLRCQTSSPAASPASRLAMPVKDRARMMIATSGRKCFELYELSGQGGSWQRTFMASLLTMTEHYSTRFTTTWRAKVTKRSRRLFFQLAPSGRRTGGIGSGLWPTAQAHDSTGPRGKNNTFSDNHYYPHDLATAVMGPTPTAVTNTGGLAMCKWGGAGSRARMKEIFTPAEINGQLNPQWVEWLMGYPVGWTDLKVSETQLSRRSPISLEG